MARHVGAGAGLFALSRLFNRDLYAARGGYEWYGDFARYGIFLDESTWRCLLTLPQVYCSVFRPLCVVQLLPAGIRLNNNKGGIRL